MKRFPRVILSVGIAIIGVIVVLGYAAASNVMVLNPGFDSDLSGWNIFPLEEPDCSWSGDFGHNSPGVLSATKCIVFQEILNPGYTGLYSLSIWYQGDFVGDYFRIVIYDYDFDGYKNEIDCTDPPSLEWKQCMVSLPFAYTQTIGISFGWSTDFETPTLRVDDVVLENDQNITPIHSVTIPLSSGNEFILDYTWTFGEMAITALLAIAVVVFCARWMYDVVIQLWSMRGDNDSI